MSTTSKSVTLSIGLLALVSLTSVSIAGVSVPTSQFDTAKPYVDRAKSPVTPPTVSVGNVTVSLVTPEPVIVAGPYTFTLADFDAVTTALEELREEARKPKSKQVPVAPGIVATVTKDSITVNGQVLNEGILETLLAAREEVNS